VGATEPEPVVLRWRATGERQVYGYLVYRSTSREGPYRRVSAEIVHVPDDAAAEHAYEFIDRSVGECRTYHYYIDQVYRSGQRDRFSGVVSKRTACGADE
jgi:hypothetical protein